MSYLGKAECMQCDYGVDVSLNRSGMAYYRCPACGVHVQQKAERGNRMLTGKTQRFVDPDAAAAARDQARETPRIAEGTPAADQSTDERPAKAAESRRASFSTFFSGNR